MKVKLVAYTPNPELVCAAAAQTSTKEESLEKIFAEMTEEKARKLIRNVVSRGHVSIVEHASFTFAVEDVSRSLTHQLVRHRIASYTQQSQRYVKLNADADDWYVIPHTFKTAEQQKKFKERMAEISKWYEEAVADGIPAEDARFYLPNAAKTAITVTMNARELLHFFGLRCCARAQWEIKELADAMLEEAKRVAPVIFESAGPNCVQLGYCPEGKMKPAECDVATICKKYKGG
jgi:thymidylate synthase (FAD)